jgi:hypothetical protein
MSSNSQVAEVAQDIYDRKLKTLLEAEHFGEFLVIDVSTGDYEVDQDSTAAFDRMIARHPVGERFLIRIGHKAAFNVGFRATSSIAIRDRK